MFVIGMVLFLGTILIAVVGPLVYPVQMHQVAGSYAAPGTVGVWVDPGTGASSEITLLLGTDNMGRDYVSLLIMGLRSSLYVGLLAGTIATALGTLLGVYGGFKGGWIDDALNSITNLFIVIPSFVVLILISASISTGRSLTLIGLIIGLTTWTWSARAVRAQSSALKSRDHISLARMNGDRTLVILIKHILPYLLSYVFMVFILQIASGILSEAAISMIGLGPLDTQSLGVILNDAKNNGALGDGVWWAFFPASIFITLIVFALYLVNTSMEGVFNPRLRR
ncbi:ABC transporter permease [Candidatus Symbiobacter mobilis]|uniref:ABC-type peptide/nickel transporter permease protein n=1 Tax=Candidatus Symbiobacter mobilis CR TaxID=946483 RepID=U5N7T9_9BURK|nr:ABC transporter permease [Candidatus Symbiobacter mobilis]AGX86269.1 ABC-type peptide/nickel transporter permease protein [Candidatus Symbiobacter mobilis CR]